MSLIYYSIIAFHDIPSISLLNIQTRKALKHKLREIKKKDEPVEQSDLWINFLKPYLSQIDELCFDAEKVDGIRSVPTVHFQFLYLMLARENVSANLASFLDKGDLIFQYC